MVRAPAPRPAVSGQVNRVLRFVIGLLGAYLAICLLAFLLQRKLMYFPIRSPDLQPAAWGLPQAERLTVEPGLCGWWLRAPEAQRRDLAVVLCNGNAGHIGYRAPKARVLADLGLDVLLFDYPGYGCSAGAPSRASLVRAGEAAFAAARRRARRVGLYGESIGSAVAVEIAAGAAEPAFLILEGSFPSAADLARHHYPILPVRWFLLDRFDSAARIERAGCPALFLHAAEDEVVPLSFGRRLYERAREPKRFAALPRAGHNDLPFAAEADYRRVIAEFLESLKQ